MYVCLCYDLISAVLRLTFPVREGMMLKPFQLEHGKALSHQPFHLKESVYRMLLHRSATLSLPLSPLSFYYFYFFLISLRPSRNDLELQFKCYHANDKLMLCQWPQGVSVSIDGRPLPIDRVSKPAPYM